MCLIVIGTGAVDARTKSLPSNTTTTTALQSGFQNVSEDAGRIAPPSNAEAFSVSLDQRERLRSGESASTMPDAAADLKMWSPSSKSVALVPPTAGSTNAAIASRLMRSDTMHRFARGIVSRTSSIAMSLTRSAMRFIGTPYVFGGTSPSGFDCSGYTQHVFAMLGIPLPRMADAQYYAGRKIVGDMTTGDLVFFQTYEPGPSHVGIYVGGGKFIHSSSHGVMVSRLGDSYWRSRYIGAKRIATFH